MFLHNSIHLIKTPDLALQPGPVLGRRMSASRVASEIKDAANTRNQNLPEMPPR